MGAEAKLRQGKWRDRASDRGSGWRQYPTEYVCYLACVCSSVLEDVVLGCQSPDAPSAIVRGARGTRGIYLKLATHSVVPWLISDGDYLYSSPVGKQ